MLPSCSFRLEGNAGCQSIGERLDDSRRGECFEGMPVSLLPQLPDARAIRSEPAQSIGQGMRIAWRDEECSVAESISLWLRV